MPRVLHWPLDEDSGTTATDVVGSNDGTITGATVGSTGILGTTAYSFDGTDDYVEAGSVVSEVSVSNTYSWGCWFNADSTSGEHTLLYTSHGSSDRNHLSIDSDVLMSVTYDGATFYKASAAFSDTTSWHFALGTWEPSSNTMRLYLDAVEKTGTTSVGTASNSNTRVGIQGAGNNPYDGLIDNPIIWDHALTPAEVQYLYNASQRGDYLSSVKTS